METDQAKKVLKEFYDVLFKAQVALEHQEEGWIKWRYSEKQFIESEKERNELNKILNIKTILLNAYIREFGEHIMLCNSCDGEGGFDYGEQGGEECPDCNGSGIMKK